MFGECAKNMPFVETAKEGSYFVTITNAKIVRDEKTSYLEVSFSYQDNENLVPNSFRIYEPPADAEPKVLKTFISKFGKFKSAFRINFDFDESNVSTIVKRSGVIHIKRNNKGYMAVMWF